MQCKRAGTGTRGDTRREERAATVCGGRVDGKRVEEEDIVGE
jgi:hypothetical protein